MVEIGFRPISNRTEALIYVVLVSRYRHQWVIVRHGERTTWEIPGGHIEEGESPNRAAARELVEETGACEFDVKPVTDYYVTNDEKVTGWGRLYFCDIRVIGPLGPSEIAEVSFVDDLPDNLTYGDIQPELLAYVKASIDGENQ